MECLDDVWKGTLYEIKQKQVANGENRINFRKELSFEFYLFEWKQLCVKDIVGKNPERSLLMK